MTSNEVLAAINACVIIPTYNNGKTLKQVLDGVRRYTSDIIVVNDGSTDETARLLAPYTDLTIIHLPRNSGKGFALRTGFLEADARGFDYAISIDSDGQHFPDDIPKFADEIQRNGPALLIGDRNMNQAGIPGKSSFGNRFSNFWFRFETGITLADTQSGFRLYPLKQIRNIRFYTTKFEFEVEVIVKAAWRGIPVRNIPVKVLYNPAERVSHFRPFRDFTRISILNTWLVVVTLLYIRPRAYLRTFREKGFKRFFLEDLLHSDDSTSKKASSVALGVLVGLSPLWGFQTITVFFLAFVLRLNKLIAFAFSNISLPPLIPLIIYAGLQVGAFVLGEPTGTSFQWTNIGTYRAFIQQHLTEYIIGSLVLSIVTAAVFGVGTYLLLNIKERRKV
ncbi:Glycosyltransferase involved in cell wall bisynthesis [Parapedobacter luteus]|uniref:Glycosyltransferase involved in cell wall bisynthesis n=1 Tax=Parapedobacter luteus TaxID=623280 RepID=A0A1T5DTW8_9SPHI|nr:DUF2062 domain-containing protein [Parapedobacter luteus]SKB74823.1 Glycosyltransferase involved in cell wall bisynthesis [Parapedobacter luteus]